MVQTSDKSAEALRYYRNLVARAYREIRYLGTNGFYEPLARFYDACKEKYYEGRTWIDPLYESTRNENRVDKIEQVFAQELGGLSLEDIQRAFAEGDWGGSFTGGPKWATIVEATLDLRGSILDGNDREIGEVISRINAPRHNTRAVVEGFFAD